jgi:hypothetical protein
VFVPGYAARLASAQPAHDAVAARAAYARAIEAVEELRDLQSLLVVYRRAIDAAASAFTALREDLQESQRQISRATLGVASTSACLLVASQRIEASIVTAERYRQSAHESLKKTSEFSIAPEIDQAARLAESAPVFRQRFATKQALIEQVASAVEQRDNCASQIRRTDEEVESTARAFVRVVDATRRLVYAVEALDRLTVRVAYGVNVARARGWLTADAVSVAFPLTPRLSLLRERVNTFDGLARLQLSDPHPDATRHLNDYQDKVLRAVVEEDAHRFLTLLAQSAAAACGPFECPSLIHRAREQASRAADSIERAEEELRRTRRAIQENPGLGTFARDPAAWMEAQRSIEDATDLTASDMTTVTEFARSLSETLSAPVASALARALGERREAYRNVFGAPEPPEPERLALAPPPRPAAAGPAAKLGVAPPPGITRHAFEVLALRSKESPDYGAYTYVIFPLRQTRVEYQALLTAIVTLTPAADPGAPLAVKRTTNLFEIPGMSAAPISPAQSPEYARRIENYDWGRALSLVQTALDGVLTSPRVLNQFQRSPGPFLLTLPVPLEQARGNSQLLLADLSNYPTAGYIDVVRGYQNDLVTAFPTTQTLWRPPWNQQLALQVLNIGVLIKGQNFVDLRAQ